MKMGLAGDPAVYLDVTHIPREVLERKLEGILEIYEKFVGVDPACGADESFSGDALHHGRLVGGQRNPGHQHSGNLRGGRMRIPVSRGEPAGREFAGIVHLRRRNRRALRRCVTRAAWNQGCENTSPTVYERERVRQQDISDALLNQHTGTENPLTIWREMGDIMTENVTVIRYNAALQKTLVKLDELSERFKHINLQDRTQWSNQTLNFVRELGNMLVLAKVITLGALARNETRGAHYKPEFPDRDDENWLKTTIASCDGGKIKLDYQAVDISLLPLRERKYTAAK